jgi:glycosyltransferase involved in cell wall biosynthesis
MVHSNNVDEMFNFIPKQPADRIPEFMAASDAAFLSLTENQLFDMTIPAKLQSYLACGIPILASAKGETSNIINESGAGLFSPPGNEQELAKIIIKLSSMSAAELNRLGSNARIYYDKYFNKQMLLNKMDKYFESNSSMEVI